MPSSDRAAAGDIRLLISDPSLMGCSLLRGALERSRFVVLAHATTEQELIAAVSLQLPDVVLIHSQLFQNGTLELIARLRAQHAAVKCIVLAVACDRATVLAAFRAGVRGVFPTMHPPEQLYRCIRAVHGGQFWLSSDELGFVMEALAERAAPRLVDSRGHELLTPRECEVVSLVTEGMTNRDISEQLHLSEHTVKNYLFRIFDKLGVSSRAELILYALSQRDRQARAA